MAFEILQSGGAIGYHADILLLAVAVVLSVLAIAKLHDKKKKDLICWATFFIGIVAFVNLFAHLFSLHIAIQSWAEHLGILFATIALYYFSKQ